MDTKRDKFPSKDEPDSKKLKAIKELAEIVQEEDRPIVILVSFIFLIFSSSIILFFFFGQKILWIPISFSITIIILFLIYVYEKKSKEPKEILVKSEEISKKTIEGILKTQSTEILEPNDENTIQDLKKDILTNSNKMLITDLIIKTSAIANIKKDKKTLEWLNNELYGYPEGFKKIPDYRQMKVRLNVKIDTQSGKSIDLSKDLLTLIYGGSLISFPKSIETNPDISELSFFSPMPPHFINYLKERKIPITAKNFDLERAPYIVDRSEIDSLIIKLKQKIIKYVSDC